MARLSALEPRLLGRRYEWARPGQLLHVDIKKVGCIGRVGHRITGDRRSRVRGIGWEYVHVGIDDCSRLAYTQVLPDERGVTVAGFLRRAAAWFARRGIIVERLLSDNGPGYRSDVVAAACRALQLSHRFACLVAASLQLASPAPQSRRRPRSLGSSSQAISREYTARCQWSRFRLL